MDFVVPLSVHGCLFVHNQPVPRYLLPQRCTAKHFKHQRKGPALHLPVSDLLRKVYPQPDNNNSRTTGSANRASPRAARTTVMSVAPAPVWDSSQPRVTRSGLRHPTPRPRVTHTHTDRGARWRRCCRRGGAGLGVPCAVCRDSLRPSRDSPRPSPVPPMRRDAKGTSSDGRAGAHQPEVTIARYDTIR